MIYNEKLFWRRAKNLYKAWQEAEHPDFKRMWMDKLQTLMQQVDKDRKSTRLNSSHSQQSRMPSSA